MPKINLTAQEQTDTTIRRTVGSGQEVVRTFQEIDFSKQEEYADEIMPQKIIISAKLLNTSTGDETNVKLYEIDKDTWQDWHLPLFADRPALRQALRGNIKTVVLADQPKGDPKGELSTNFNEKSQIPG